MTAEERDEPATPRPRRWRRLIRLPRRGRGLFVGALILLILLIGLWLQRRPIADRFVSDALASRGVAARYTIADVGFSSQRLTDVVIGDPANPDLVADWVEVATSIGFGTAEVTGIRAGNVRLRGRLVDGALSLGEIDKLLPPPSGKPFALPDIDLDIRDGRMRLETPFGVAGLKLTGRGHLTDGFRGTLGAVSARMTGAGCTGDRLASAAAVRIVEARLRIEGPVRAAEVVCGDGRAQQVSADLAVELGAAFDRWSGQARLRTARLRAPLGGGDGLQGRVLFAGDARRSTGTVDLGAERFAVPGASGRGLTVAGQFEVGAASAFQGTVAADRATVARPLTRRLAGIGASAAGTPVAPLAQRLEQALIAAARDARIGAAVSVRHQQGAGHVALASLDVAAASGARVRLAGGDGVSWRWPDGGLRIDGTLAMRGGGLPDGDVTLAQAAPGAPVTGTARFRPYAAGGARIALAPVDFSAAMDGATAIETRMTLSGPLGDGRVDDLSLPLVARWNGRDRLRVNPGCVLAGFDRLAISGLALGQSRMTVCPEGGALVAIDGGAISGGARIASARLAGTLGGTPLTLGLSDTVFRLRDRGFTLASVEARLGEAERISRLDIASLRGRIDGSVIAGSFEGGAGQIANVPLLISEAAGDWRLDAGRLTLDGRLNVADAAQGADRRFEPLASEDFTLTLLDNRIDATGTLIHPEKRVEVADVVIRHDLGSGTGGADLDVAGIGFDDNFQPHELTPVTFGVIADVKGTVSGEGRIRWSPEAVTSDGTFRTAGTDLAAAFGPVTGIAGEIRFTDLLGLVSADRQVVTLAEVNPGIPVRDGQLVYRLLGGQRVAIEGGRWPFAGGEMVLEPTVLDFSAQSERRMTFRVSGVDAALFLQEFDFENLTATGTFDGVLPMVFDAAGGRIVDGRLDVREGGGTIAYVGEVSKEDVGFWGNLAFDALKSLNYEDLELSLNGPLSGEMVTSIRFSGVSQGAGTRSNFIIDRIARLPLVFNITIRAPFRQLLDSVQSYYDPSRLIERNLPALLDEQQRREEGLPPAPVPIQPSESENVP